MKAATRRRRRTTTAFACAIACATALSPAAASARRSGPAAGHGAAATGSAASLHAQLARYMRAAGPGSGAYVYDVSARRVLFASAADRPRPPASVEKLFTSTTALIDLGPDAVLRTTVLGVGALDAQGTWNGTLYLHGAGDPSFGDSGVAQLARSLHRAGVRSIKGAILGDESFLDSLRGGPTTGYRLDPYVEGTLSALAFDRGATGRARGPHAPAVYAAQRLAAALRSAGVRVQARTGAGTAPVGARELAAVDSPRLRALLGMMLPPSDNFFAEMLVKDIGADFGGGGTTAAGARVVRSTMARLGLHISVVDGSGLSRADQTSPHTVGTLLSELTASPLGPVLRYALARPGVSGTLVHRMRASAAVGRCEGKTGTLMSVSNLAGWCTARGGHTIVFALLMDGVSITTAHAVQDAMCEAIAGFDDGTPAGQPAPPPPLLARPTYLTPSAPAGPTGPTGPTGPAGATGPTGPAATTPGVGGASAGA